MKRDLLQEAPLLKKEIVTEKEKEKTEQPVELLQPVHANENGDAPPVFEQPVEVTKTAVIPDYAAVMKQRKLTWKERRAQKQEQERLDDLNYDIRREHIAFSKERLKTVQQLIRKEQAMPAGAVEEQKALNQEYRTMIDEMVVKMRDKPLHGEASTDYQGMRSPLGLTDMAERLERVAMTYLTDPKQLAEWMAKIQPLTRRAQELDKIGNDFRFRNQNVPGYIVDVLKWPMVPGRIKKQLDREAIAYDRDVVPQTVVLQDQCGALMDELMKTIDQEEVVYAKGASLKKGERAKAYNREIQSLMDEKKLTREEAREHYYQDHLVRLEEDKARDLAAKDKVRQTIEDINQVMPAEQLKAAISNKFKNPQDKKLWNQCIEKATGFLDELEKQLLEHPPMTDQAVSMDHVEMSVHMVQNAEYLERVILGQIKNPGKAKSLLKDVRKFTRKAEVYDARSKRTKFRQERLRMYIRDTLKMESDSHFWAFETQLARESKAYTEQVIKEDLEKYYHEVEDKIFAELTPEQRKFAKGEDMTTGVNAKVYNQTIEDIMEEQHLDRTAAKEFYSKIIVDNLTG